MYFKSSLRHNPITRELEAYYRLVESYRNLDNRVCHRTLINVGFLPTVAPENFKPICDILNNRSLGKVSLFADVSVDPTVQAYADKFWEELVAKKKVDVSEEFIAKQKRLIDVETMTHSDVREIGSEWLCYQALEQLKLSDVLQTKDFSEEEIQLAYTQIISRAVYPYSEYRTSRVIQDNSAICEVTHYPLQKLTKDKLYQSALHLYQAKDAIESHLSKRTNELFDLEDTVLLYDLTNTYFEGRKEGSKIAKFGRSKEKRTDAKLVVLALVVNVEGFIKYSQLFEGNQSDSTSLPKIIDALRAKTSNDNRATVVLDAGIATEENLQLLKNKGYDYVCVSRSKLKEYSIANSSPTQSVKSNTGETISLQKVETPTNSDYYLKIDSPGKKAKEESMGKQFEQRFLEEVTKIQLGLTKKNRTKKADKVSQRLGRVIEKYPSIAKFYDITVNSGAKGLADTITITKRTEAYQTHQSELGTYFVRTNLQSNAEATIWKIYNSIREIESTFRCLKTDLDLRPIYHKNDDATMAHLHLGILAYWLVNAIRHQLKAKGIDNNWQELIRIASTKSNNNHRAKSNK